MTELNTSATKRFDFSKIFPILFQPQRTFTEIAAEARASWSTPMLVLSLTTALTVIVSGFLQSRSAIGGEVALPPDWQYWTPEMQNNFLQAQQTSQGAVVVYVMPLVSALIALWLGWLILGGILHLGSTLFGGRGSMQSALNVAGWANLPFGVLNILQVFFMLLAGHAIVSPGLSGFAGGSVFLSKILEQTDVFFIWNTILLILGFGIADGLPRNKAVILVVAVVAILLLISAGVGTMVANIGGGFAS